MIVLFLISGILLRSEVIYIEKPFDVNDTLEVYYDEHYDKTLKENSGELVFLSLIRFYQKFISPAQGEVCNFSPSCSNYMFKAIRKHGPIGVLMGIDRLQRCNHAVREYLYLYYDDYVLTKSRGYKIIDNP